MKSKKQNKKRNWWKVSAIILAIIFLVLNLIALYKMEKKDMVNIGNEFEIENKSLNLLLDRFEIGQTFLLCDLENKKCIFAKKIGVPQ